MHSWDLRDELPYQGLRPFSEVEPSLFETHLVLHLLVQVHWLDLSVEVQQAPAAVQLVVSAQEQGPSVLASK